NLKSIKTLDKELETLKEEKDVVDGKLASLLKSSKDLENLIESQRYDKVKEGVGYNAVPPPAADLYLSPKKDLSWTGLPEFADDTVTDYSRPSPTVESTSEDDQNRISFVSENREPTYSILSKPAVKFVKVVDKPAERPMTNKAETVKKPTVKYAEMYRIPSKKPTVRGNQQNWNNLKSQQLGPDFVMKKKACYNCGDFSHLANDCRKRVQRETTRSQNHAYKSPPLRSSGHRPHGPPMRPMRSNMNGVRPKRTSAVRPQYKALWVPTVNKNFPLLIENFPLAVINRRNRVKDVQASACWVWKSVKPNSASIILKKYGYVDVRGRSSEDKKKQRNKKLEDSEAEHQV
nr:ubiquitin hydrolase [Tanacetum cinerariifolium]